MAGPDPCLTRINRALRDLGSSVSLEVSPSGGKDASAGQYSLPLRTMAAGHQDAGPTRVGISGSKPLRRTETC